MATGAEVLSMLLPNGGWVISGDDFDSIQFNETNPITREEFEAGFAKYDSWKLEQENKKALEKAAILARLGITEEEAKIILG